MAATVSVRAHVCAQCGNVHERPFRFGLPTADRHSGPVRDYDRCVACIGAAVGAHGHNRLAYDEEAAPFRVGQGELF